MLHRPYRSVRLQWRQCLCVSYGSYSGAVPNEKISWGKLEVDTPKYIIESDATIVAPLIFAHVLGW